SSKGSITLEIEGGYEPYNVVWDTGTEAPYLKNLASGTYTATLTDAGNCKLTRSFTLTEPKEILKLEPKVTLPKCFGDKNAEIQLKASGGTSPYTYKIGNVPDSIRINLAEGTYMVRVTDSQQCMVTDSVIIKSPRKLAVQTNLRNTLPTYQTGSIETCVTGGMPPYSYAWDDRNTKSDRYFLAQGPYSLIVTDFNECYITIQSKIAVSNPKVFELIPNKNELPVFNPDSPVGSCKISAPYAIKIFNSQGISIALYQHSENKFDVQGSNLLPGLYHYLVFDKYGNAVYKANFFI
ncbi:MAG TPA: hypothetical protein DCQ31_19190, partial [Bacteroidales bacterium]|nr:hypothetical protein [Bacteroidales bacterium]